MRELMQNGGEATRLKAAMWLLEKVEIHVRVSDCDAFDFDKVTFLEGVEDNHKVAHGVEGAAAL